MVTEIETEVWTCIDLLTILTEIGHSGSHSGKMVTVQERNRVKCEKVTAGVTTFQYSEKPMLNECLMNMEEMSEVRE